VIIWIISFVIVFGIAALCVSIKEACQPPPPPPFEPPPIQVSAKDENDLRTISYQCAAPLNNLAATCPPGWPYRAALVLLDAQLPVVRAQFDRLLATPPPIPSTPPVNDSQYYDYRHARRTELQEMIPKLAQDFRQGLAEACQTGQTQAVADVVTAIALRCQWLYQWGLDEYSYYAWKERNPKLLQPRIAEHVFRQVEKLVAELRYALTDPQFTGPLLFRAEFYLPEDAEVDKPVISVVGVPK